MFLADAEGEADQINASWACENERTLNQILKGELGFQGYIMSDWGAHHSTLAAVNGLDVSHRTSVRTGYGLTCAADEHAWGHHDRLGN